MDATYKSKVHFTKHLLEGLVTTYKLSPYECLVYVVILDIAVLKTSESYEIANAFIAKEAGVSKRTASSVVNRLIKKGLITVDREGTGRQISVIGLEQTA